MALDAKGRERLTKFLGMMGSDQDGEALSAARMAHKLVAEAGVTWAEVLEPQPLFAAMDFATPFGDRSVYRGSMRKYTYTDEPNIPNARWWVQPCRNLLDKYENDMTGFEVTFIHVLIKRTKDLTTAQGDKLREITKKYVK